MRQLRLACLAALASWSLAGCGAGAGTPGVVTGVVSDAEGSSVAGARVRIGSVSTTSLSNGTFRLTGIGAGIQRVHADIEIRGRDWSGETLVDVVGREHNRSVNVVVSETSVQGIITGVVRDERDRPLEGAKVFVGGPWGSTLAITDRSGAYEARRIPAGFRYTVTCSVPGFLNQTHSDVLVTTGLVTYVSFTLRPTTSQGAMPGPDNLSAQAWTLAASVSRAADGRTRGVYDWLRRQHRLRKGLPDGPVARSIERLNLGRATPAGSVVEIDLFWTYASYDDLFGYVIRRGMSAGALADTALLRDPLARVFFDVDAALTPDRIYYYTVHRVDTVDFPARGSVGLASDTVSAQPLQPIVAESPGQGASVSVDPLLVWSTVQGAAYYQIYVWDRFPDLQSETDPDGAVPIWGYGDAGSLVAAPTTERRYAGPALAAGRTYYWLVVASDAGGDNLSASQIARFTAR
ncbi:MAG TPA: carboxypeptidase-like regulatory domain-containing protein [Chthonomonadales bacterium]|nr:carboxypeptidase-like regulatory domain-containing protein [Chthonomonadales bacterium]